jgi:hypothetical protein
MVHKLERLAGLIVQAVSHAVELRFSDDRQIDALRYVLAKKYIGILIDPSLPRAEGSQK